MVLGNLFHSALLFGFSLCSAPLGPWDAFNYAPTSRTVWPVAIHSYDGNVQISKNLIGDGTKAKLSGNGAWVALDFGKEACSELKIL